MPNIISTFKEVWTDTTRFEYSSIKISVIIVTTAITWIITLRLSTIWQRQYSASTIVDVVIFYLVFFTIYFCFCYMVTSTLNYIK